MLQTAKITVLDIELPSSVGVSLRRKARIVSVLDFTKFYLFQHLSENHKKMLNYKNYASELILIRSRFYSPKHNKERK